MSLIIATGSNLGNSLQYLIEAKNYLSEKFTFIAQSQVYISPAVEYTKQPNFLNQMLEFEIPNKSPESVMDVLLGIEAQMGRRRDIPKGPRTIDLDIIFWGAEHINKEKVQIPHPRWSERSFIVKPLSELPFYETLEKCFRIPTTFNNCANPYKE